MIQELQAIEDKYRQLTAALSEPAVAANPQKIRELAKERAELEPVFRKYEDYKRVRRDRAEAGHLLADPRTEPELRRMAEGEVEELEKREKALADELRTLLLPKDPNDEKNVILEIRAGAGGDEASLFAQDLFRMYSRFAEKKGWKLEVVDTSFSPVGGLKEAIGNIRGKGAYSILEYESGVHRVQRVPKTEASGRIHTSTATVAVLPEVDEIDLKIDPKDLKIEAFGSSGPGGQNVNRNYTAIRVTHKPSGLVVSCQDEKSQHRNKERALRVLRSRLMDIAQREQQAKIADHRRSQVGTGDRSEKIRTYNFPQSRITDHRLNENFHNVESILDGDLDDILARLVLQSQAQALGEMPRAIPGHPRKLDVNKTLLELYRNGVALLGAGPQAVLEAKVLLLRAAAVSEERFLTAPDKPCSPKTEAFFRRLLGRRLDGVPLAYLTGTREFWSIPFEVTPSVLVPRPETEALVEKVLELSTREDEAILDVGTGSGCIAIALAKELPRARIQAVDVSERALRVARRNAARHKAKHIQFLRSDLLSAFRGTGVRFDFIVSNPPYISLVEWDGLPADVRDFEPRRALLAGESGLELIERLVRRAGTFLKPGGYLIFEIGAGQRDRVLGLFGRRWTEIETAWDLAGKPRVITARRA